MVEVYILKIFSTDVGKKTILTTLQLKQNVNDTWIDNNIESLLI